MINYFSAPNPHSNQNSLTFGRLGVWTFLVIVGVGMCAKTFAQSRQVPAPPQERLTIIHSAVIHPVTSDVIDKGYMIFDDGVITHIGRGDPPVIEVNEPQTERLNANGLHIYPGLISSSTYLGLIETDAVDVTHDHSEFGRVTPEVRAAAAVNPDTDLIPVARANGILTAHILPRGGLISGRSSLIRLDGWTWESMAINVEAGLVLNWPRTEPITAWWMDKTEEEQLKEIQEDLDLVERVFDEASAYIKAKDADSTVATDLRFEAMRAVITGKHPLFIRAVSSGQIESAVAWAMRRELRPVIVGGYQADDVISLLKEHDIPVIVEGTHRLPINAHDDYDQPFTLPLKLHKAGIRYCIASGDSPAHERSLNHSAALASAYGLSKDDALKSVTLYAAQILGVGDQLGSLEVGKAATFILTDGDPLEITTDTRFAFIDGRRIDLGSRHKSLYEKYQEKYRQLGLIEE